MTADEAATTIRKGERRLAHLRRRLAFAEKQTTWLPPKEAVALIAVLPDLQRIVDEYEQRLSVATMAAAMLGATVTIPTTRVTTFRAPDPTTWPPAYRAWWASVTTEETA